MISLKSTEQTARQDAVFCTNPPQRNNLQRRSSAPLALHICAPAHYRVRFGHETPTQLILEMLQRHIITQPAQNVACHYALRFVRGGCDGAQ